MATKTKIEWTEETWNPIAGCDKVSAGCKNCYAIGMAWRLKHMPHMKELYGPLVGKSAGGAVNWTGKIGFNEKALMAPLERKKPTRYFVNSMSDLFHDGVPFDYIDKVFAVMAACPQHTFQVLTKRPERMVEWFKGKLARVITELELIADDYLESGHGEVMYERLSEVAYKLTLGENWPLPNVWVGVSVEDQKSADARIPLLLRVPAAVRWLSCEPMLGAVDLQQYIAFNPLEKYCTDCGDPAVTPCDHSDCKLKRINWVVCGGESGHGSRPMHPEWARGLRDQCKEAGVPFFFKQWGDWSAVEPGNPLEVFIDDNEQWLPATGRKIFSGDKVWRMRRVGKHKAGRELDGVLWDEYPQNII